MALPHNRILYILNSCLNGTLRKQRQTYPSTESLSMRLLRFLRMRRGWTAPTCGIHWKKSAAFASANHTWAGFSSSRTQ